MSSKFPLEDRREPIAIIGIGCRFPGEANDPETFWKLLVNGVDAITEIPEDRWSIDEHYHPAPGMPGKTYSRWGGFTKDIDKFDPEAFGISPREASQMDPQQRFALEVAWEALEDAGQVIHSLSGSNTGVFLGISHPDYSHIQTSPNDRSSVDAHSATGGALSIAANRISYCLNLTGPSLAVDTACSSSLVATHLACQSIWNQECSLALAGGVNIIITTRPFVAFCAASMLSPDGRCKAFDADANGFVRAEGVGFVVLKPLAKALEDKDPIYALISGTAVNQDGRTAGIALPSQAAQEKLIREACMCAGVSPADVDYVETHGTGTAAGDPIEAIAIGNVLSVGRPEGQHCVLGSAKTNIGHLESASGIAGLIKGALAIKHRMIPPNLHFKRPNPAIPFENLKLRVLTTLEAWPKAPKPAIAGVNSFGFGGTNAHVVMTEYRPQNVSAVGAKENGSQVMVLPISAHTADALQARARSYREFLDKDVDHSSILRDLCYTASVRRSHLDHRLSLVFTSKEQVREFLTAYLDGERRPGMFAGRRMSAQPPKLAFVFSGQGPQWWGMGKDLVKSEAVFRDMIYECDSLLLKHSEWSLIDELYRDEAFSRLSKTAIAQPAIFSLQVALAALWKSWGVEPAAVVGHSVGELAAAFVAGSLGLEDAIRLVFYRAKCMDFSGAVGKMLAVGLPVEEATKAIAGHELKVSVAAINSHRSVTLSGEAEALQQISESLTEKGVFCRFLAVDYAFHCPQMDPIKDSFLQSVQGLDCHAPAIPLISTVTGMPVKTAQWDENYWWQNIREKVRFAEGMDQLFESDCNVFLEVSPHPVLSNSISECLQQRNRKGTVLPSLRRNEDGRAIMLGSVSALYTLGYPLEWQKLCPDPARYITLPTYPWQRQSYWHESEDYKEWRLSPRRHPLLGRTAKSANPTWENVIDKQVLSYLDDHKVRDAAVFPGAAYVEMGLAAANQAFGTGCYTLEEMQFQKAFFLSDRDGCPTVQLVYDQADDSFAIYSKSSVAESAWDRNSIGYMKKETDRRNASSVDVEAIKFNLKDKLLSQDCYEKFAAIGLNFGPSFRGIKEIWKKSGEALAVVELPENLYSEHKNYLFHPAFLDSCFQVLFSAISQNNDETGKKLYLPVQIKRVRFYGTPPQRVWSHAILTKESASLLEGYIKVFDEEGHLCLEIDGFTCAAVGRLRGEQSDDIEKWFYELRWQRKPIEGQQAFPGIRSYIPSSRQISRQIQTQIKTLNKELERSKYYPKAQTALDNLAIAYLLRALRDLGFSLNCGSRLSVELLTNKFKIFPHYRHFLNRFLIALERRSYTSKVSFDEWSLNDNAAKNDLNRIWRYTFSQYPAYFAEINLIAQFGSIIGSVLQGTVDPVHSLFRDGSIATAEDFYQNSPTLRFYNLIVQNVVARALENVPKGRPVRILEIGAGTGGMTNYVAPLLPKDSTEYVFTDVSRFFLDKAEQKFHQDSFFKYQLLDIEHDPLTQGFDLHSYDIVLASNVLHATQNLRDSLDKIKTLLSPQGLLVVLECEKPSLEERPFAWWDLVFGSMPGWWRFTDFDLRSDYPLISKESWKNILSEVGFCNVNHLSLSKNSKHKDQIVLIARSPQTRQLPDSSITKDSPLATPQDVNKDENLWLIFADKGGVADQLISLLKSRGELAIVVTPGAVFNRVDEKRFSISPSSLADMERLLETVAASSEMSFRGVIHLWSLDASSQTQISVATLQSAETVGCHSVLHFIQALSKFEKRQLCPKLILVTRGAQSVEGNGQAVSIEQAPLIGLGRVINNEVGNLFCKMVDLASPSSPDDVNSLFTELFTDDEEIEIVFRNGSRFVPRLKRVAGDKLIVREHTRLSGEAASFRLELPSPGAIDNLVLRENKRSKPGAGQIEIEVVAASLNFRDVMKVLGLYPLESEDSTMLGDECSGRIVSIGDGVETFKIGDAVMAVAPSSFGSFVTTSADLAVLKPKHLSFEEAATIPIAFLTAYYSLHHQGRILKNDRVLIQSAAGGVGLAALQIAQDAGAEVFATVGSSEKRELLKHLGVKHIMNSRSLTFADEIKEVTNGQGVNIVLNSLAGKAIAKGISALAPYGRFLELGKRDLYQNSRLGLWDFRKNISFSAIDLGDLIANKPSFINTLLTEVVERVERKTFCPLPHKVLPISKFAEAFRTMAQGKHIGKIVLAMRDDTVTVERNHSQKEAFSCDGTYLIVGGLGGLGLTVAKWIAENGGRHLVLMGRSGAESEEAKRSIFDLQKTGARVEVAKADVSDEKQVAELFADIAQRMPPVKGIFQSALVLQDNILLQSDVDKFRKVMAPKVTGSWNLHYHSLNQPLELFVLFSSVSSLFGSPGQGNYAAANAFLDSFSHFRRSLGLPAVTINWGRISDVGYIARHPELSEALARLSLEDGISPDQAIEALNITLQRSAVQTGIMRINWRKLSNVLSNKRFNQRFSALIGDLEREKVDTQGAADIKDRLQAVSPEEQTAVMETFIREHVARVLGTSTNRVEIDRSLNELGLDSLMAVELKNRIEADLQVSLSAAKLVSGPSIQELSKNVLEVFAASDAKQAVSITMARPSVEQSTPQVDQLSDQEVDFLLKKMLEEEGVTASDADKGAFT